MKCSRSLTILVALVALFLVPQSASAKYGELDASFGMGGKIRLPRALSGRPKILRIQPDGKILFSTEGGLFRLTRSGKVDNSFTAGGAYGSPEDLEVLSDGRIALIEDGRTLTVLKPNGRPDRSFANSGILTLGTGATGLLGRSLAVQGGTKILVSGALNSSTTATSLIRVNSDGSIDPTFGDGGTVTVDGTSGGDNPGIGGTASSAIAVNDAGEILLGIDNVAGPPRWEPTGGVVKFSRGGARIMNFGTGGIAPVRAFGDSRPGVVSIAVANTGNFIAIGKGIFWGPHGGVGYFPSFLNANGNPVELGFEAPSTRAAVAVPRAGFMLGGFVALRGDYSKDARFGRSRIASVTLGDCDNWGPVAAYPDGALVSISEDPHSCDDEIPTTRLTMVRLLGPSGGKPAPFVSIQSRVETGYQHGGVAPVWLKSVSGVAGPADSVREVGVGIQLLDERLLAKGRCRWLTNHGTQSVKRRAKNRRCTAPRFMLASGHANWKLTLRRPLPSGSYRLYVRAKMKGGATTPFNMDPDNFRSFLVSKGR